MRALNQWLKAAVVERGADVRRLVTIHLPDGPREFITGSFPLFGVPNSVLTVSPNSIAIDPWTRATTISERVIVLRGERLTRQLHAENPLEGCRLEIRFGAAAVERSRFEIEWIGQIRDSYPNADGSITIRAGDVGSFLRDVEVSAAYAAMNPIAIIADIYSRAEVPIDLYDPSTFDFRAYPDLSHLSVTRAGGTGGAIGFVPTQSVDTPTAPFNAWTAVQELCSLVGATVVFDHYGRQRLERIDPRGAPSRHWPRTMHDGLRIESTTRWRCDQINVEFAKGYSTRAPYVYRARAPADVLAAHRFAGAPDRPKIRTISTPWVNGVALAYSGLAGDGTYAAIGGDVADDSITLMDAELNGFAGLRFLAQGSTDQDLWDRVSAARRAYYQIEEEIVELYSVTGVSGISQIHRELSQRVGVVGVDVPFNLEVECFVARGALGTTRAAHPVNVVAHDVTIPKLMADDRARFFRECPTGKVRVPLSELDLAIGDKLTLDDPAVSFLGCDGADSDVVWEVIGLAADDASLEVTLCLAYLRGGELGDRTPETLTPVPVLRREIGAALAAAEDRVSDLVVDGLAASAGGGLELLLDAGEVSGARERQINPIERSIMLPASSDVFVRWSTISEGLAVYPVALGDPEPSTLRGVRLAKVTTDGSSITAIKDHRPTRQHRELTTIETAEPRGARWFARAARVRTSDGTATTVLEVALEDKTAAAVVIAVSAAREGSTNTGAWIVTARVRCNSGATVVAQSATYSSADDVAWAITVDATGDNLRVRVTGAAAQTIEWTASAHLTVSDVS